MAKIAVIKTGGKQYKVRENDLIKIEKLPVEQGQEFTFEEVLLVADEDGNDVKVGTPLVGGAKVTAIVEEQGRSKKITVIKYKAKTRYRRKKGHRQAFSKVRIKSIA